MGSDLVLRRERQRRHWSLTYVSGLTGIAAADLSMIERGERKVFPGWRRRIAAAFQEPEELLFAIPNAVIPAMTMSDREDERYVTALVMRLRAALVEKLSDTMDPENAAELVAEFEAAVIRCVLAGARRPTQAQAPSR